MAEVAGEVADGLLVHAFTTEKYLREVTIPALEKGLSKVGKTRKDIEVAYPGFVITGDNEQQIESAIALVKAQVSFYGSTPAYRPVLEMHGWGDLQTELNKLSKQGQWAQMAELIDDDVLAAFSIRCSPEELPGKIAERFGDVIDRFSMYSMYQMDPEQLSSIVNNFKSAKSQ
jgi:probable F420-dependent oxidoreductase